MRSQKNTFSDSKRRFFFYGLRGGILATAVLFIGTSILALPFPPVVIFQLLISPVPGSIQSVVVETFLEYAKYTAFVVSAVIYAGIYGLLGILVGFLFRRDLQTERNSALAITTAIPSAIALAFDALLTSTSSGLASSTGWLISGVLIVAANLVFAGDFVQQVQSHMQVQQMTKAGPTGLLSRRGFLKKAVVAAVVLIVAGFAVRVGLDIFSGQPVVSSGTVIPIDSPPTETNPQDLPAVFSDARISNLVGSEVTDSRVFYRVDIDPIPPQLNLGQWSLKITGKVNNSVTLDKDGLMALPAKDEYATLECISNTINPPAALISNAKWTGVSLAGLLNQAGLTSDAKYVVFHCADGYTVGIPLDRAIRPEALLAYKMNDETLPNEHGFPLRTIVPGIYGMMNAKWITGIEVVDYAYLGYWQDRGWSNDARINTTSLIYYPSPQAKVSDPIPIAGVAFAGDRGISKVEVSVDGGRTWNLATLKAPRSPYSWVLWAYAWTPTNKGSTTVTVRAYDGAGTVQNALAEQSFPNGASGLHSIQVTVT